LLAVVDDVDADGDLPRDDLGDGVADPAGEGRCVAGAALVLGGEQLAQIIRPRQASGMGGQGPLGAALHRAPGRSSGV